MVFYIILLVGNDSLVYEVSVRSKTCKEVFQPVTLFLSFTLGDQLFSDLMFSLLHEK